MRDVDAILSLRMRGMEKTMIRQINDLADPSCINLGLGELQFPTPKAILSHVRENLDAWPLGYSPNEGFPELRELIAVRAGYPLSPEQVCVTVGAEEALMDVLMVLAGAGDEILIPDPGFPAYPSLVRLAGAEPRFYPLLSKDGFQFRAENVLSRITPKTKAIIINSPHNPTGTVHSSEEIEKMASALRSSAVMVISDEVYRDIVFEEPAASPAPYLDRCITVNSLSKSFAMTGWRIGWCAAPPDVAKAIRTFHQLAVMCATSLSQYAAIHALRGFADDEKGRNVAELEKRRDFAMSCVDRYLGLPYVKPAGTFYLFLDISAKTAKYGNSLEVALKLLRGEKVVTIPGSAFGRNGEGYLRLSFAPGPEMIEEGIKRIGRFFS
jgi:aspartate/methionine/tyrosine aminotransferase